MKKNLPVTTVERIAPDNAVIVSKTDLKGSITYANQAFTEITGYTREELIGQNHSIVRHPDMPPAVFADLWSTLNEGRPWRGVIKNRCRNGDYHWVATLVVPMYAQGAVFGYLSVAGAPSRQEAAAAEELYRAVNEGRSHLHRTVTMLDRLFRLPFTVRYALFVATMASLAVGAAAAGLAGWQGATIASAAGAVLLAAGSAVFMRRTVSRPLEKTLHFFERISQGDLHHDIDVSGRDEAGRVLAGVASVQANLRVIIDEIRLSSEALESRCGQLDGQVGTLASHSRAQIDRVMQVSSAMEQVSVSVTEVAKSAEGTARSARSTLEVVDEGNRRMSDSLDNTSRVVASVQASSEGIDRLSGSIGEVGKVTRIIKDIADQTNLLALNAAIEAARAGEHGRGFAVVADEVRKLAERTARSTEDIERMVEDIQATTASTVESMRQVAERVEEGRSLVGDTHLSLRKITEASADATRMSEHIAAAAKEQSAATDEVARNAEQMSGLIEQSSRSVEQVACAANELRQTAAHLHQVVAHFSA